MAKITLPDGKKVEGVIKEGKTYLSDGSRVPVGAVVDTGAGGTWKMTDSGGVKVKNNAGSWISSSSKASTTREPVTSGDGSDWVYDPKNNYVYGANSNDTNSNSYSSEINALKEAQQRITAQQLRARADGELSALDQQEKAIAPAYQAQRSAVSARSEQNARSFAEFLANRGLTYSGASAQGEINRYSSLQNAMGQLGTQEAKAYDDINSARAGVERDYASNLASANLQLEADYLQKIYEENQGQKQIKEQLKQQSLYQYADDYQAKINELLAQGYSPDSTEVLQLQALKGAKIANNYGMSQEQAINNIILGNIDYNTARAGGFKSIEDAYVYYNNYKKQLQAQSEAQAKEQALEEAYKKAQINNIYSQIGSRNGDNPIDKTYDYDFHFKTIEKNFIDKATETLNVRGALNYINQQLQAGTMSQSTANKLMLFHQLSNNNISNKQARGALNYINQQLQAGTMSQSTANKLVLFHQLSNNNISNKQALSNNMPNNFSHLIEFDRNNTKAQQLVDIVSQAIINNKMTEQEGRAYLASQGIM